MPPPSPFLPFLLLLAATASCALPTFREAPAFRNGPHCPTDAAVHIAMTLDSTYLRGSIAAVFSILQHSSCPENITFHFITAAPDLHLGRTVSSTFPSLEFHLHAFRPSVVLPLISSSIRPALDDPLNYARIYLADLLPESLPRVLYFDSDLVVLDDVSPLFNTPLGSHAVAAPLYCHANFSAYFTRAFWSNPRYTSTFRGRPSEPCYFNTGVMVIDLRKWREGKYREKLEGWMRVRRRVRIYELGSLPPFLLVFSGNVEGVEHRWNQHGLGGDNMEGRCRDLHPGAVSLLHWSGKGKPWLRLDSKRPCPLDLLWSPYDLLKRGSVFEDR
ncbi:hypothetical protein MLD38_017481 [Melastoma candidum]|uniref:Uncharacterized protein n=1 Tax=Melastoma candidum TaxID=119954 RepID=A0ACB9QPZ9_9MYRT|nr:hypothetical protein MLD38_017481 [Melastoma candidum]